MWGSKSRSWAGWFLGLGRAEVHALHFLIRIMNDYPDYQD